MQFIKRPNHWSVSDDNADIEWYVQITHSHYVEFKIKKILQKLLTGHK